MMHWQNYEVFVQQSRGDQHVHQGAVHAPNAEMALLFAKEQFGRREQCANIWVVKTTDVHATSYDDADMFKHALTKATAKATATRCASQSIPSRQSWMRALLVADRE
ncbi:MAG: hypothetical protein R3B47_09815 [Bacteroidia bacterium]